MLFEGVKFWGTVACNPFNVLIYVTVLCVGPCRPRDQTTTSVCKLEISKLAEEYEYTKEGDIVIGGVLTLMTSVLYARDRNEFFTEATCVQAFPQNYRQLVDFAFAIEQINKDPSRSANLTLGYHIYDSCRDPRKAVRSVIQILSGTREPVPNYSCVGKRNIAGFIGDLTSETTLPIAQILTLYGYSQISYGATDPALSDRINFPYIFRMLQSDNGQYLALSKLLKHFGWTWVGIIELGNRGDKDHQMLTKSFSGDGICIEFTIKLKNYLHWSNNELIFKPIKETIEKTSTSVIVLVGQISLEIIFEVTNLRHLFLEKTFIVCSSVSVHDFIMNYGLQMFHGSLIFQQYSHYHLDTSKIRYFILNNQISTNIADQMLGEELLTDYLSPSQDETLCTRKGHNVNCTFPGQVFFYTRVYLAVDMMAQALQDMNKALLWHSPLHKYLRKVQYQTPTNEIVSFEENGEMITDYEIYNCVMNKQNSFIMKLVGWFKPQTQDSKEKLTISADEIIWKTGTHKIPQAQCSTNCIPSFRKAPKTGTQPCCYDCVRCSEGEVSFITDSEICVRCPYMEWPNEKNNQCIEKNQDYLSYTNDKISVFFISVSAFLYLIVLLILGVFVVYWNTPIVRANNRSLSLVLLVSIKLSFLSVFLFLGRPVDITCMLRIITFGITFSIAVSSLLAKTIMVCVAFKATKPGSSWRKWMGVKLSNSVVLFCSSIQIIICMTWLSISPPFQELDLLTYPGTIIIQCNEGSAIGLYSVIGYMGLLAAVSFVLAFLARTLPDSFNEAKYITFSMLLFCSVWITMIPAYLSTKGKNTVCVEIFAILTSSAGLLSCIFLPKCYIIYFKPKMNIKSHLFGNKTSYIFRNRQHIQMCIQ
ncbi:hypothetical protein XELAEV_18008691mg [Xenopus laevis]|uniref:G-protein coupled receptors family 3 profile domain-containing protein n=1 Tax=Xenopus laevis TaxID=8355 RepID=A0A974DRA3_XENLA|nr:hypothetical protein XELAEV_18008691mg [Xenopus laevis]